MADPVTDQPQPTASQETAEVSEEEALGAEAGMVKSTSWWGVSNLTSYLASPHLLEQGIKLLEILITGGFFNHLQSSFNPNPISNEMKALGTSLDLMKVIMKILRVDCPEQPQRPLQG